MITAFGTNVMTIAPVYYKSSLFSPLVFTKSALVCRIYLQYLNRKKEHTNPRTSNHTQKELKVTLNSGSTDKECWLTENKHTANLKGIASRTTFLFLFSQHRISYSLCLCVPLLHATLDSITKHCIRQLLILQHAANSASRLQSE